MGLHCEFMLLERKLKAKGYFFVGIYGKDILSRIHHLMIFFENSSLVKLKGNSLHLI